MSWIPASRRGHPGAPSRPGGPVMALGIQLGLSGLAFGGLVFLLAAGLSVILGLMGVLNLAHGSFYMLGAYVGVAVLHLVGSFWLALVLAPVLLALLGAALEVVLF